MTVEDQPFRHLDGDQRREVVNTRQRFETFLAAQERVNGYRGLMSFTTSNGADYLVRSYYDPRTGRRRQTSLGPVAPKGSA